MTKKLVVTLVIAMLSAVVIAGLSVYAIHHDGGSISGPGYSIGRAIGQLIFAAFVAIIGGIVFLIKGKPEARKKIINGALVLLGATLFGVLAFYLMLKWL
jgi:hypothetical protein